MYADLTGFTSLTSKLGPEKITEFINECFSNIDAIINSYGGCVMRHEGDRVMAIFGYPKSSGNDSYCGIMSAIKIRQSIKNLTHPVGVHIGIASGVIFCDEDNIYGQVIDTASMIEESAPVGEIYVDTNCFELNKNFFEFEKISNSFNHTVVREVIYSGLPEKRRRTLHQICAQTIEEIYKDRLVEFYELLFEHYSKTDKYEKAIDYGLKAGENARKRYANEDAILIYSEVLKLLDATDGKSVIKKQVFEALGQIHSGIGRNQKADEFYKKALEFCSSPDEEARCYQLIASNYERVSDYDRAIATYSKALEKMGDAEETEKAAVNVGIAWIYYLQGSFDKAEEMLKETLSRLGELSDIKKRNLGARIYNILAAIYSHQGKKEDAYAYYNKSLKLYKILNDISGQSVIYNNINSYFSHKGDYNTALEYLERSLELAKKTGNMLSQAITNYNIGETYYQLGEFEKSREYLDRYMEINRQINNRLGLGYGNWGLGLLEAESGHPDRAMELLNEAREVFERLQSKALLLQVMNSIAHLYCRNRDFDKAYRLCKEVDQIARELGLKEVTIENHLIMAVTRIGQALDEQRLSVTYLTEARGLLEELNTTIKDYEVSKETQFEINFQLGRVYYYLGDPEKTLKYLKEARQLRDVLLGFMKTQEAKERFLQRHIWKEFDSFTREIKV